ncbi:MAG: hypothetical protein ABEK59_04975 [Halobacteria archaeon]
MGTYLNIATAFAAVNVVLLSGLLYVWISNYRKFGTSLVLGLIVFSAVLWIQNLIAIYFFAFSMKMLFSADATVQMAVMVLRGLEFLAVLVLTYVTMK